MKCMEANFGGRSSFVFGDIAMVHVHQVWLAWFFLFGNFKKWFTLYYTFILIFHAA